MWFDIRRKHAIANNVPYVPPTMTIETTSTSASWSPFKITNNGSTLVWEVSGGVTIPPTTINDPTFDLSTNTGTAIITAKDVSNLILVQCFRVGIQTIDVTQSLFLEILGLVNNGISVLDISNNLNLISFNCSANNLTSLSVSNNTNLLFIQCQNNPLTPTSIDNIIIDLDNHGLSNGTANIPLGRTSASDTAYYNLETVKNWIIEES